MDLIFSVIYHL